MPDSFIGGQTGVRTEQIAAHRILFKGGFGEDYLPGGKTIDGTASRDPLNTGAVDILRTGLVMGKITSSGNYAPSILGITTATYTSGGTTLTVSAATAVEVVRRIGTSGTFKTTGPPSAAGTVATITTTFSAVNTTTGAITVTSLGVNMISGALIQPTDGSEIPKTIIPDGFGIKVLLADGTAANQPFPALPIRGTAITGNIINYSSDSSLKTWLKGYLRSTTTGADAGLWVFDDAF